MTRRPPNIVRFMAPVWLSLAVIGLLFGGVGAWAVNTRIAGAVIAQGRLETRETPHDVSHPVGGLVARIAVRDGDYVEAGSALLHLDETLIAAELVMVSQLVADLFARQARLEAERVGRDRLAADADVSALMDELPGMERRWAEQQTLLTERLEERARRLAQEDQRLLQIDEQIGGYDATIVAGEAELVLIAEDLDRQRTLEGRGLGTSEKLNATAAQYHRQSGTLGEMRARRAELTQKRIEVELGRISLEQVMRVEAQDEIDEIFPELARLIARRTELKLEREQRVVRAPVTGFVHELKIRGSGSVARPGHTIVTIIPESENLQAVVRVAAGDIDQVYRSQTGGIRFHAFNARTQPLIEGTVENIAAEAAVDPLTRKRFFEVFLTIPRTELELLPEGVSIINGMELSAFIQTDYETPFFYVTKPIRDYLSLAFRDRA
ncbi:MAG: HlyD family type I secretion periplasmic adaptor subunit [Pseudomonadota bacterium]